MGRSERRTIPFFVQRFMQSAPAGTFHRMRPEVRSIFIRPSGVLTRAASPPEHTCTAPGSPGSRRISRGRILPGARVQITVRISAPSAAQTNTSPFFQKAAPKQGWRVWMTCFVCRPGRENRRASASAPQATSSSVPEGLRAILRGKTPTGAAQVSCPEPRCTVCTTSASWLRM